MNLLIFITQAFRQVVKPDFGGFIPSINAQFDGGVGHIVAAALQTKGIIDQAQILQNLTELNSIASLFYLFAVQAPRLDNYSETQYLLFSS